MDGDGDGVPLVEALQVSMAEVDQGMKLLSGTIVAVDRDNQRNMATIEMLTDLMATFSQLKEQLNENDEVGEAE